MSYLDHIRQCNAHDLSGFRRFEIAGARVGWIRHALAERLPEADPAFLVFPDRVELAPELRDFEARSATLQHAAVFMRDEGCVPELRGEGFPVMARWGEEPLARLDRAVVAQFGIAAYGLHVNGYVRREDGGKALWIARRAFGRGVAPGLLDNMVAGGQPIGLSLQENLLKEAEEEASIPPGMAKAAVPVGAVSYTMETPEGLKPDTLFLYDLELDPAFVPENTDGEVDHFLLWSLDEAAESVRERPGDWKYNCGLVVIDFLIRHGYLTPDEPDYLEIVKGLRQ